MNILLVEDAALGKAKTFLVRQVLTAAAANAGHKVVERATDADIALVLGDNLPNDPQLVGKKVYLANLNHAFATPENTVVEALAKASDYVAPSTSAVSTSSNNAKNNAVKNIVAVTACPTGVAHTFMSAEAIEAYAKQQGWNVKVETRGQVGAGNPISAEEIAAADLVFVAADIDVDLSKFDGKLMYRTSTGLALKKTAQEFDKAFNEAKIFTATAPSAVKQEAKTEKKGVYSHLMTGVSHMLPVVVAGGLIIALSFVFGIEAFKEEGTLAAALMKIGGGSAFGLMIPVLSGYIAYSIADRPGLTPGLVGGMLASSIGAGFLGGIISGFLAGYVAKAIADHVKLPPTMNALKPILIIPFIATLVVGLVMIYVVGEPVAWIMRSMTEFLTGMQSGSAIMLGVILGAMMCFDMGGPVNKAAYTFGVGLLASSSYLPMAAVMAAGMVPALGMGLATFLARKKFNASEREGGKASFVLGLCFISEGAIPFAARDPMRVIPSCMAGGALAGALSMLFGAKLMAPHGGIFVLAIPGAIQPVLLYLVAIIAGTALTGFLYAAIKPNEEKLV